jgi:hypothetical protein
MRMRPMIAIACVAMALMAPSRPAAARGDGFPGIERRPDRARTAATDRAPTGRPRVVAGAFLVGVLALSCGLWARDSGRRFAPWFVAGLLFNGLALMALYVVIRYEERAQCRAAGKVPRGWFEL